MPHCQLQEAMWPGASQTGGAASTIRSGGASPPALLLLLASLRLLGLSVGRGTCCTLTLGSSETSPTACEIRSEAGEAWVAWHAGCRMDQAVGCCTILVALAA